ncbi:MAG: glycosyltransferase family 9 protein [Lentisphaeria bacterium]|nr:glycosyltransferase family 9 protein [Lentisphaeria bacterium]
MGILDELHRIYTPCEITVFAVPLIAELYRGHQLCAQAVELEENPAGEVSFRRIPQEHFDVVFNHGYCESWNRLLEQLDYDNAYGMEEPCRPPEKCRELFTRWISSKYWNEVTLREYSKVSEQMAELIRLVDPACRSIQPSLSPQNYKLTPCPIPQGKYVLMLPGASSSEKRWPIGKFLQLAKILSAANYRILFATGPAERHLAEKIESDAFTCFDTPKLSELAFCIAHADAVIGNDSGPMHMAACFDRPSIHFFSFSGAETWFQYDPALHKLVMPTCGRKSEETCGPCHRTCIGKITVKQAYRACKEILGLPEIQFKKIGYFATPRIGDSLVAINNLCACPLSWTVFIKRLV